ncbi:Hypothetical predicted protein [Olea europaea subsp. europaea]|uniref:Uncharacterized protein n=1 Tax=Olea europaea subsp. europaea TaxID=158383 RepID=A0A8S0VGG1_OLEEU|nr:Hypothetical predicted protein [Olea europaea subsp. europaea]
MKPTLIHDLLSLTLSGLQLLDFLFWFHFLCCQLLPSISFAIFGDRSSRNGH